MSPVADNDDFRDVPTELVAGERRGQRRAVLTWNGGSLIRALPATATLIIGRGAESDLRVDHTSISRSHARVVVGDVTTVEDLGSSNGTWVEGVRLATGAPVAVRPGVLVEIGSVLLMIDGGAQAPAAGVPSATRRGVVVLDPEMERVHELVELVARASLSVILLGETGVGKDVLAHRVHHGSARATKPFLKVNCAALSDTLIEAELFGFERGAFTGAVQPKEGLLEAASEGTLFLDELGELPLSTQAKLLRVLESGEVTRLGALKPRPINVRFVSATNHDLKQLVAAGRFRQDLFFRLDGLSIRVPPLRQRPSEIPALAQAFVRDAARDQGRPGLELSGEALAALVAHGWPGNVRELKNVIARSTLLCRGTSIQPADLQFEASSGVVRPPASVEIPASERQRIVDALDANGGNQTLAAKALGMSRRTMLNRLDALGLKRPRKREPGAGT
jgi:two-component system, NtrC family, response regulator AtoC